MSNKRVVVKLPKDFSSKVFFGQRVEAGQTLGIGTVEYDLEAYILPEEYNLLIDNGVFAEEGTPLVVYRQGFEKQEIKSRHSGLVKIEKNILKIVDVVSDIAIPSPVSGRIILLGKTELVIEAEYTEIPMFVFEGGVFKGRFKFIKRYSNKISKEDLHNISAVILQHTLTNNMFKRLVVAGVTTIVAPFIDWIDYKKIINSLEGINLGILYGFGSGALWEAHKKAFSVLSGKYIEIDFQIGSLFLFEQNIVKQSKLVAYKDSLIWAKEIDSVQPLEKDFFVAYTKGKKYIVNLDETLKHVS